MSLWNWGEKFYKREYYLMRIFQLLLILLLGNCTLTENIQKEEDKDFIEAEWKQEAIDINYMSDKERLDYFYTQELVDLEYLAEIYPGYVEVGTLNRVSRESLRYTWEEARLLAMREFDFQKEKENWEQYTISERPRLLLEEGSKDFYRYYEYFVIDDVETIQGSILIPTYKRTEELITAGVRRYRKNGMFYEYQEIKYIFPELNEERLDFFYNHEDLNKVQISDIFVDLVNSNPLDVVDYNKLKIDWKKARELALDEFEYQKDRLGWGNHQVSEKPKLVLDENIDRFYRHYEFFVRDGKNIVGSILIPTLYIADSTQAAEVRKYSKYGETQVFEKVMGIQPEFTEERLEYFCAQEIVDLEHLAEMYPGYVEVGTLQRIPRESLRYTWQEARLLAMRELDFQKEKEGWGQYTISERPRLLLEEGSETFYRYYEFFVRDDKKAIHGSIVIPRYKRTEDLMTTSVRKYLDNGVFEKYQEIKYILPELNEERLDFFYNHEDLNKVQISDIFVDLVNSNPLDVVDYNKLKIDWKKARELALDEFEYQKDRLGWGNHQVSEKPKLVLDENIDRFYRHYEFFVRDGKNIVGSILIPTLYIADSTQAGEVRKYSKYGETQVFEKVTVIKPEFTEERLEYFYNNEPIAEQQLSRLYEGEFPEGEKNPKKLRIHWKDARELALAELELQKDIQKWTDVRISDTAILINDEQEAFYRYYEYRVYRGKKVVGAIRIPAYRRTENFATAAVHVYADDELSYTVHPTGWGQYVAKNSILDINSSFIQSIAFSSKINKNFIYTIMNKYLSDQFESPTRSLPTIPDSIAQESMNSMINRFEKNNDAIKELKSRNEGDELPNSIHNKAKNYYKRENSDQYKEGISKYAQVMAKYDTLINVMNDPELDSNNKVNLDQMFVTTYLEFIKGYFQKMSSSDQQDVITKILSEFYWSELEKLSYNKDRILMQDYELNDIFMQYKIAPYVVSKDFEQTEFLQDQNIVELLLTIIPQKIGFTIQNQNYTIKTFIPPTQESRTIDRDKVLGYLQGNLDKIDQNINDAIDKDNSEDMEKIFDKIHDLAIDGTRDWADTWDPGFPQLETFLVDFVKDAGKPLLKTYTKGAVKALLKNLDLAESFMNNIVPMAIGCSKLTIINEYLQKNGIEKISEKDGKDIWFLERMCAILGDSLQNLKDFDKDKPKESAIKLIGPILKVYMDSIYYAMSRSCDRWTIPPVFDFANSLIEDILLLSITEVEGEPYEIKLGDIYSINMDWYLGALHHSWWKKNFRPITNSYISTRGAFCYWRYAHAKKRYGWSTYTDW